MLYYEMLAQLGLILLLYLFEHSVYSIETTELVGVEWKNQDGCICNDKPSSFINSVNSAESNDGSNEGLREKRQVTSADDIISSINTLLGNNSTLANITAMVLANLTTGNLSQILEDVTNAVNTSTIPLATTTATNTTLLTTIPTIPTTTQSSTSTSTSTQIQTSTSSSSSSRSTTTIPIITSSYWFNLTNSTDITSFGTCNTTTFSSTTKKNAQILSYVGSGWVIGWICLTVLVNLCCRAVGFERVLDFLQEAGLIVTFVFMGFFVLRPDWSGMCRATQIVLHASMVFVLMVGLMQAVFSSTLNRGTLRRTGGFLAFVYYLLPVIVTAGFTCGVYFPLKSTYDNNGVHCFAEIYSKMFWTFNIPFAILLFLAMFFNQLGVTACNMAQSNASETQLFWSRKTARGLPLILLWFGFCFFTLLFAIDMQLIWLVGVYVGLCALFGPMLFVFHTYCYKRTSTALWRTRLCFYKPCPEPLTYRTDENVPLTAMIISQTVVEPVDTLPPQPVNSMPIMDPPAEFEVINPPENYQGPVSNIQIQPTYPVVTDPNVQETSPDDFYNWVIRQDDIKAENVLFKRP